MLRTTNYDPEEIQFLKEGFTIGFDIGYRGPMNRQDTSRNLPFSDGIGDKYVLWEKVMKEVEAKRYAGPYSTITYRYYVQSPSGLVPKANNKTRLIFHLSYDFKEYKSINFYTPEEICTIKYRDLNYADKNILRMIRRSNSSFTRLTIWMSITDLTSAFRIVPVRSMWWPYLAMQCKDPETSQTVYFLEKNLAFGSSISCNIFQRFSNALAHIVAHQIGEGAHLQMCNYLDDFIFLSLSEAECHYMVRTFMQTCETLGVPVSLEKTVWPCTQLTFLGMGLDGVNHLLTVPEDKRTKARNMLKKMVVSRKATVKQIQSITGLLNFIGKAIFPGRAFTRRMYASIEPKTTGLQQYHHVPLDAEFRDDCKVWLIFLNKGVTHHFYCRPFVDIDHSVNAEEINFFMDASKNTKLGFRGIYNNQ